MTQSPLPLEMKQACCKTCLVAEKMKDCKNCPFNVLPKTDAIKNSNTPLISN